MPTIFRLSHKHYTQLHAWFDLAFAKATAEALEDYQNKNWVSKAFSRVPIHLENIDVKDVKHTDNDQVDLTLKEYLVFEYDSAEITSIHLTKAQFDTDQTFVPSTIDIETEYNTIALVICLQTSSNMAGLNFAIETTNKLNGKIEPGQVVYIPPSSTLTWTDMVSTHDDCDPKVDFVVIKMKIEVAPKFNKVSIRKAVNEYTTLKQNWRFLKQTIVDIAHVMGTDSITHLIREHPQNIDLNKIVEMLQASVNLLNKSSNFILPNQ